MRKDRFERLKEGVKLAFAVSRGEAEPSREFRVSVDIPDVKAIREKQGMSQRAFAETLGISIGTLRNWEQGRCLPDGPSRLLLKVLARSPEAVLDAAHS